MLPFQLEQTRLDATSMPGVLLLPVDLNFAAVQRSSLHLDRCVARIEQSLAELSAQQELLQAGVISEPSLLVVREARAVVDSLLPTHFVN